VLAQCKCTEPFCGQYTHQPALAGLSTGLVCWEHSFTALA